MTVLVKACTTHDGACFTRALAGGPSSMAMRFQYSVENLTIRQGNQTCGATNAVAIQQTHQQWLTYRLLEDLEDHGWTFLKVSQARLKPSQASFLKLMECEQHVLLPPPFPFCKKDVHCVMEKLGHHEKPVSTFICTEIKQS